MYAKAAVCHVCHRLRYDSKKHYRQRHEDKEYDERPLNKTDQTGYVVCKHMSKWLRVGESDPRHRGMNPVF